MRGGTNGFFPPRTVKMAPVSHMLLVASPGYYVALLYILPDAFNAFSRFQVFEHTNVHALRGIKRVLIIQYYVSIVVTFSPPPPPPNEQRLEMCCHCMAMQGYNH